MTKIVVIHRSLIHKRPPVQSTLLYLSDLGFDLSLVTLGINDEWMKKLEDRKINYHTIPLSYSNSNPLFKLLNWVSFRRRCRKIIESPSNKHAVLWIASGDALLALGQRFFNRRKFIIQVQELYDTFPLYKRKLNWYYNHCLLSFVPEYNRAMIVKSWYQLQRMPVVLPNKPHTLPEDTQMESEILGQHTEFKALIDSGKKIILYQGVIHKNRDLTAVTKAMNQLDDSYHFVIMGRDVNKLDTYLKLSDKITYVPNINAPNHLYLTRHAYIGILVYDYSCLNHLYCAPNKLYEYGAYGIPMIGNNLPGLKYPLEQHNAGTIFDLDDPNSVLSAIRIIEKNYDNYVAGARHLFNRVHCEEILESNLKQIGLIKETAK